MNEDRPRPGRNALVGLLLFALAFAAYHAVWHAGFVWDDDGHVTRPDLRTLHGLGRIWAEPGATQQYYPLLHTAFWVEHRLWGDFPEPYHLLNIALHAGVGFLLYGLLRRLRLPGAVWAAAAFTLHPVGVETVAWVSEQKNTLSGVLALGAALAYLRFDRDRGIGAYAGATVLFVLALLTKTVTATLPGALLVLLWWQRGRLAGRDVRPLLPWFALAAGAGAVTAWVEHTYIGATGTAFHLSAADRVLIAGRALWFYLGKVLWPHPLIFIYPHWTIAASAVWPYLFPAAALAAIGVAFALRRQSRGPLAASLLFAGILFPALGFINVFPFIYSFVADHFQYLAAAVVIAAIAAAAATAVARLPRAGRHAASVLAAVVVAALGWLTARQARAYVSAETLWQDTLTKNPGCWMADQNLGGVYLKAGRAEAALPLFRRALELHPDDPEALNELGVAELHAGQVEDAVSHLRRAQTLAPADPETPLNLGVALLQAGREDEATAEFAAALRLNPGSAAALKNLAMADERHNAWPSAISRLQEAARLEPLIGPTHAALGAALQHEQRDREAEVELRQALALDEPEPGPHVALGVLLARRGESEPALAQFRRAIQLDPNSAPARYALATGLEGQQRHQEAEEEFRILVDQHPAEGSFHTGLGFTLDELGQLPEAEEEYRRALALNPDDAETSLNLGKLLLRTRRPDEAVAFVRAAVAAAPPSAFLHNLLGIALAQAGRLGEAEAQFRSAERLEPGNPAARRNLEALLRREGRGPP